MSTSVSLQADLDRPSMSQKRVIAATTIGNAFEWYDIQIYGAMAPIIALLFFPAQDDLTSMLLTLGTLGVTFFMRPVGAIVLGSYADKAGRKAALSLSLLLMTLGSLIIAFLPTYGSVGAMAPIGIVVARLLQGFSAGGEYGSATALLAEQNPRRRGFFASWQPASQGISILSSALISAALYAFLTRSQLESWGWRLPFLFGALVGPVGLYLRRDLDESPEFSRSVQVKAPMVEMLTTQKLPLLIATGTITLMTIAIYTSIFMPTYAIKYYHVAPDIAFVGTVITGAIVFVLSPLVGAISDRVGRTVPMLVAVVAAVLLAYPMFVVLQRHPTVWTMIAIQSVIGVIIGAYFGPLPALMSEIFPTHTRTSGLSLSYNLGVTIFGGFAPFILTAVISLTNDLLSPAYYLMFGGVASGIALMMYRAGHAGSVRNA